MQAHKLLTRDEEQVLSKYIVEMRPYDVQLDILMQGKEQPPDAVSPSSSILCHRPGAHAPANTFGAAGLDKAACTGRAYRDPLPASQKLLCPGPGGAVSTQPSAATSGAAPLAAGVWDSGLYRMA